MLTLLAAIYLPISLATSIFGMNIQEIGSDRLPRWWAVVSVAAGFLLPTFVIALIVFA